MREIIATEDRYVICHNNEDVVHFVFLRKGNKLVTGQPFVEEFTSIDAMKIRVEQLSQDPELLSMMTEELVLTNDNETLQPTENTNISGWSFVKKIFNIS